MTTKKHKVSAYLTDDEFEVLKGLATQYQVSQSQIVILAIRELAKLGQVELMELPVSYLPNAISGVTKEDMELLVKNEVKTAIADLSAKIESLENAKPFGDIEGKTADLVSKEEMNQSINTLTDKIKTLETAIAERATKTELTDVENSIYKFLEGYKIVEDKTENTATDTIPKNIQNELPLTSENDQPDQPIEAKESLPIDDIPLEDKEKITNDEIKILSGLVIGDIKNRAKEGTIITLKNGTKYNPIKEDHRKTLWEKIKTPKKVEVKIPPAKN